MADTLFYQTASPQLISTLKEVMTARVFEKFRLVGGTALSLQIGHRVSVDIDLFTDEEYDSINFKEIGKYLRSYFDYVDTSNANIIGMGTSYFIGKSKNSCIKLDIFYTDTFIRPAVNRDGIRMADIEDIIAMKVDVISRGGRMKDFWDIHELITQYSFSRMLALHKERYPYSHNKKEIKAGFTHFTEADKDFTPVCLRNKYWEVMRIKG